MTPKPTPPFQPDLLHETVEDALRDAVRAIGGSEVAGLALWPTLPAHEARNRCNDCLNPSRAAKFSLAEVLWILRRAREVGYHGAMAFVATECGYAVPTPLAPEDERAQLQREFVTAVETLAVIQRRLAATTPRAVNAAA